MLTDFRSYEKLILETDTRPVILTGHNGAGKTNILEALSYLTVGRGLRGAKLSDVSRRLPEETQVRSWAVSADYETPIGTVRLGSGMNAQNPDRRLVHVDGKAAKGAAALAEHITAVWLTPSMDRLFNDTPGGRRRFMDRLVTAVDPEHASRVAAFDQAQRRRSRLFRDGVKDASWFEALEDTMARYGVAITVARHSTVARLNGALAEDDGPFPAARLGLRSAIDEWVDSLAAVDAEDALRRRLEEDRAAWSGDGEPPTAQGPNRSDLDVVMTSNGRPAAECSTGEQKALLVSIILAHVRVQAEHRGQPPLLLLDEIAAHLDEDRRRYLFDRVVASGVQAWLTGTDIDTFTVLRSSAQIISVADGRAVPIESATILSHPKVGGVTR